jgi:cytidylate kinase
MIVTIDGPAGAGKSTVARRLAEKLGFEFLDTGAMYRAVTWAAVHHGLDLKDDTGLSQLASRIDLRMELGQVTVDGIDVSEAIRTPEITCQVKFVADPPAVRSVLVELQRRLVGDRNFVTEGRDQGTVAFPDAQCKVFLTATPETRALRRWEQLAEDQRPSVEEILQQQNLRDERDANREVGRLVAADDAQELATDGLSLDEVVTRLVEWVESRRSA